MLSLLIFEKGSVTELLRRGTLSDPVELCEAAGSIVNGRFRVPWGPSKKIPTVSAITAPRLPRVLAPSTIESRAV
jgi:hypothetical protein